MPEFVLTKSTNVRGINVASVVDILTDSKEKPKDKDEAIGKILYIKEDDNRTKLLGIRKPIDWEKHGKYLCNFSKEEQKSIKDNIEKAEKTGTLPHKDLRDFYKVINEDKEEPQIIILPDDTKFQLEHSDDPKVREVWRITGGSGSWKSTIAKHLADSYRKFFPEREVFLISNKKSDVTLDSLDPPPRRIFIEEFFDEDGREIKPEMEEFRESMVIADDFDSLTGKEAKMIDRILMLLATEGRETKVSLVCLSHKITDGLRTRTLLGETNYWVVYPQHTKFPQIKYLLVDKIGLDEEEIESLKKLGRWVMFHTGVPNYLISPQTARFITN